MRDGPSYTHLHELLPAAGVGVVTFDRRGEGESTGDVTRGRFELQVEDALAVMDAIDAKRVGLWGISQGGWIGPLAAAASDDVAFLVLIASTGVWPSEQMLYAVERQLVLAGYGQDVVGRALDLRRRFDDWVHHASPARDEQLAAELKAGVDEPWWPQVWLPPGLLDEKVGASGSRRWTSTLARSSLVFGCRHSSSTVAQTPGRRSSQASQRGAPRAATRSRSSSSPAPSTS